jgi:hypothetical protein
MPDFHPEIQSENKSLGEFPKKTFNPNTGVDKKTSTCKKLYMSITTGLSLPTLQARARHVR